MRQSRTVDQMDAAQLYLHHSMRIYGTIVFPCFLVIGLKDDLPYMDADMAANLVASCQGASDADVADYLLVSAPIRDNNLPHSACGSGEKQSVDRDGRDPGVPVDGLDSCGQLAIRSS